MGNVLTDGNGHVIVASNNAFEVTSAIDSNIQAGNIKKDVTILGVTGTYEGSGGGNMSINIATLTNGFTVQIPIGATLYYRDSTNYFPCYLYVLDIDSDDCNYIVLDTSSYRQDIRNYLSMNNLVAGTGMDLMYGDYKFYIRIESPALGQDHDSGCISIGVANVDAPSNWPLGINSIADIAAYAIEKFTDAVYAYNND